MKRPLFDDFSYEERRKEAMKTMETTSSWLRFQGHRILSHANATVRFGLVLLFWCLVSFSLIVVFYNGQIIQLFTIHFHSIYFPKKFTKTSVIVINGKKSSEYVVTLDSKHELLPIMLLSLFFFFFLHTCTSNRAKQIWSKGIEFLLSHQGWSDNSRNREIIQLCNIFVIFMCFLNSK